MWLGAVTIVHKILFDVVGRCHRRSQNPLRCGLALSPSFTKSSTMWFGAVTVVHKIHYDVIWRCHRRSQNPLRCGLALLNFKVHFSGTLEKE